jgi:hypothetical protein
MDLDWRIFLIVSQIPRARQPGVARDDRGRHGGERLCVLTVCKKFSIILPPKGQGIPGQWLFCVLYPVAGASFA